MLLRMLIETITKKNLETMEYCKTRIVPRIRVEFEDIRI